MSTDPNQERDRLFKLNEELNEKQRIIQEQLEQVLHSETTHDERVNMNDFSSILGSNPLASPPKAKVDDSAKEPPPQNINNKRSSKTNIQTDDYTHNNNINDTGSTDDIDNLAPLSQIRIQKAKIKLLQEEIKVLNSKLKDQDRNIVGYKNEIEKFKSDNKAVDKETKSLRITIDKQKHEINKHLKTIEDLEKQNNKMKDLIKEENNAPQPQTNNKNDSSRLNRIIEELDKYKNLYSSLQSEFKTYQIETKKKYDEYDNQIMKLGKQRSELIVAFKKQMKLIDILKRQILHIEAAKMLNFTEEEFARILEFGNELN